MASLETICARLCLLTRFELKEGMPPPLTRPSVRRMLRLGALEGLALRDVPGVKEEHYARAKALLSRSAEVYAELERYRDEGYDVLLPEDDGWPVNLHALGTQMPQFLFVCGNRALLEKRAVAVAGSREIAKETFEIAVDCGKQIAQSGYVLVCGGAWGVDTAVQRGALDAGGELILVPAMPVKELLGQNYLCDALVEGRLLLACDTWPDECFSGIKALSRNHAIYALGDAALVIASQNGKGGSWHGATDCLRGGYTPVFALTGDGADREGNRMLIQKGAKAFDSTKPLDSQLFARQEEEYADQA